ncbi:trypco2 family protein [Streptomyces aidingensis]|uniref:Trypsin-co-occurring domain-containing protein n=1 Tax=Streptomyces aidingensis TaxID=910347 RepID=A0A1I1HU89_9ACTN|nr:trypco2 family protein [Streptomyces aidingensis]SFC27627.1 hypothetical protein SAMN05421773_102528 [Streptomyces aidingensis]
MIELAEMIRALRQELNRAHADGRDEAIQFDVGPVELESSVVVDREAGTGGRIRFLVAEADGRGRLADSRTQRIALTLHPRSVGADGTVRTFRLTGDALAGED